MPFLLDTIQEIEADIFQEIKKMGLFFFRPSGSNTPLESFCLLYAGFFPIP
jgi:hypothetical protein